MLVIWPNHRAVTLSRQPPVAAGGKDEAAAAYEFGAANSYSASLLQLAEMVNAAVEDIQDVKWRTKREEG
jgi:hypothetical protein